jgi:hypothetical protein
LLLISIARPSRFVCIALRLAVQALGAALACLSRALLSQATSAPRAPEHPCAQVLPARGKTRMTARRSGRRALAGADHIGMEVVLRLRQVRQKKAEVHAESPRAQHSRGRNSEESQQTRLRTRQFDVRQRL